MRLRIEKAESKIERTYLQDDFSLFEVIMMAKVNLLGQSSCISP